MNKVHNVVNRKKKEKNGRGVRGAPKISKTKAEPKALQKVNATAMEKTANEVELTKEVVPDVHMTRARALMRLFIELGEAMQKLKGKTGQQKVTVEHVHVHHGGQAIVGAVTSAGRTGGGAKQEGGSDEKQNKTPCKAAGVVEKRKSAG